MPSPVSRLLLAASLLLLVPGTAPGDSALAPAITRFQQVDAGLYRGGQPDAEGFAALKRLGIRTVVNLRHTADEQRLVESAGLRYVALPTHLRPFGVSGGLSGETVRSFFRLVDDAASGPIFLHCRRGADRTGTLVAMYRIARQGWTPEAAYKEARAIGMRWWHYPVRRQLDDFARAVAGGEFARAGAPAP
jgi:protein tyrosine/serine phosphatase